MLRSEKKKHQDDDSFINTLEQISMILLHNSYTPCWKAQRLPNIYIISSSFLCVYTYFCELLSCLVHSIDVLLKTAVKSFASLRLKQEKYNFLQKYCLLEKQRKQIPCMKNEWHRFY